MQRSLSDYFVRLSRLALMLIALWSLLIGILITYAEQASESVCLLYDGGYALADLNSGQTIALRWGEIGTVTLPGGEHHIRITHAAVSDQNRLYFRSVENEHFLGEFFLLSNIIFSPDGRRFAYLWAQTSAPELPVFISIGDAATGALTTLEIPVADASESTRPAVSLFGFSPDGEYIAFTINDLASSIGFIAVESLYLHIYAYPTRTLSILQWSPSGHLLTTLGYETASIWFTLINPTGSDPGYEVLATALLSTVDAYYTLTWSPDNRYVVFQHATSVPRDAGGIWEVLTHVFGVDGTALTEVAVTNFQSDGRISPVFWSTDSRSFMLWSGQPDGTNALASFDLQTRKMTALLRGAQRPGMYAWDNSRFVVEVHSESTVSLDVADADGSNRRTLIENPISMGTRYLISWSPDGGAIVAQLTQFGMETQLFWMRLDSSEEIHPLTFAELPTLRWWNGSTFIVQPPTLNSALMVNTLDGIETALLENGYFGSELYLQSDRLMLAWNSQTGMAGLDFFAPSGERLRRYPLMGTNAFNPFPNLYWSPDFSRAVVRSGLNGGGLQILNPEGETITVVRDGQWTWSQHRPVWSPDSQMFALPVLELLGDSSIYIIDVEGRILNRLTGSSRLYFSPPPEWTACH